MSFVNKSVAAFALTAAAAATSAAFAAGFQLMEHSAVGQGRAFAGAGIVGDDLSALHFNAAGMTLLPGTRVQAGGTWIAVNAEYEGSKTGVKENGRYKGQLIPHGYISHQINDQVWAGLALTVPYGMGTEFNQTWEGAERGNESMILTFDINPNVAWKINDFVSVGAGVSLQYAKAELGMQKLGMVNSVVKGDSWAWGYNLGLMLQPTESLRLGLSYRSHIAHNADGHTSFTLNQQGQGAYKQLLAAYQAGQLKDPAQLKQFAALSMMNGTEAEMDVRIKTPDTLMLTGTWEATQDLRVSATARWSKWSNFKTLTVDNAGLYPDATVENNWEDTWFFSLGADYRMNDQWTIRGGVAYDKDPITDQSTRMAVIPDTDRLWLSFGSSYKHSDNLTFDFGATYITGVGNTDLYNRVGGEKIGEFKSLDSYIFAAQMQYRF